MDKQYIVDLSRVLKPGEETNFSFDAEVYDTVKYMPMLKHEEEVWYIMSQLDMCSHCGTHIEVPYHHIKDGYDLAEFPISSLIGNLVVIDISHIEVSKPITVTELKKYDDKIKENDIVFLRTGLDKNFNTEKWLDFPFMTLSGVQWLCSKGITCLGTDAASIEDNYDKNQSIHKTLFENNIPIVESLKDLDKVKDGEYMVFILPIAMKNIEACPVRVIAIRKDALR